MSIFKDVINYRRRQHRRRRQHHQQDSDSAPRPHQLFHHHRRRRHHRHHLGPLHRLQPTTSSTTCPGKLGHLYHMRSSCSTFLNITSTHIFKTS